MKRRHTILILIAVIILLSGSHALAAVTLASFTAAGGDGQVLLEWETASEINNIGFNLWRSTSEAGSYARLNDSLIPSQAMGSVIGAHYSYTDSDVSNGTTYYYKLESVATDGSSEVHGPISAIPGTQPTATLTATPTATWTATPTATATATATLTPPPTATRTPTAMATATPPTLPTATSLPTSYPPLPTATNIPTSYPPLPTAISPPRPTSTPTSTPAATFTQTPMAKSLPTSTPATPEISSPMGTATATKVATVTLSPTPPLDTTPTSGSPESEATLTVEVSVEPLMTPGPTSPLTLMPTVPAATPQPPTLTATPTALSLPSGTSAPADTTVALPISRGPEGLGHLWLVGILLIALGAGAAWLAYSFIRGEG